MSILSEGDLSEALRDLEIEGQNRREGYERTGKFDDRSRANAMEERILASHRALRKWAEEAEKRVQDCIDTDCPQLDALHTRALQAETQRDRLLADLRQVREERDEVRQRLDDECRLR